MDPAAKPDAGADAPPSRDLTGLKGVRVILYEVPKSDPDLIYLGLNDRDKAWHDLYKLKISTGEKTLLHKNTDRIVGWDFDVKGQLRLAERSADNGDTEILRVDADKLEKIYSCSVFENCGTLHFLPDGSRVYIETNKDVDLIQLALLDPATGKTEKVESDPLGKVDFGGALFSEATDELVETWYIHDRAKTYYKDKAFGDDVHWLEHKYPGQEIRLVSRTRDEQLWLFTASSDREPGQTLLFDRKTRAITPQYSLWEKIPRQDLAEMKSITYKSSDGLEIPAYLTLPKGVPAKNQLPRRDGLREEVPGRGQPGVGPQDAGRCDLGREISGCRGHRRSQAGRDSGRFLWRLRNAGGGRLYAGPVFGGGGHCGTVKPDHAVGVDSSVLGVGAQGVFTAVGRRKHAGR